MVDLAYFLFIDESGQDRRDSPYEVLAGVAIEDVRLWDLVQLIRISKCDHFGTRYTRGERELKGKKLLKRKTFRLAGQLPAIPREERSELAFDCLQHPTEATFSQLTALAQAKLSFAGSVLDIAQSCGVCAFASVVDKNSPPPEPHVLRKDYSYLFQRFFFFLEDIEALCGIVVFDELEKSRSHVLLSQMDHYFTKFRTGRQRSSRIIPEPFFVHSDLTTGVQVADLIAYITSWGIRFHRDMTQPARRELDPFAARALRLRHRSVRPGSLFGEERDPEEEFGIWSFAWIPDLRPRGDRAIS